jgi:FAD:protein FMN transferase
MINGSEPVYSSFRFGALGTQWEIATGEPLDDGLRQLLLKRIDDFERTYSRFRDDSLVAHIAAAHEGGRFLFPEDSTVLFDSTTVCTRQRRARLTRSSVAASSCSATTGRIH